MSEAFVLGADVGGTHTKVALARVNDGWPVLIEQRRYPSRDYETLEGALEAFLAEAQDRKSVV